MDNTKKYILFINVALIYILMHLTGCKETEMPDNPYDAIDYTNPATVIPEPDPNSIEGLHKNIFSVRCALPGCHDGTFEPDFRTVQSSYASLVYQPVIKTTVDSVNYFSMRVVPFSNASSFLYERITTATADYMPSNGVRLEQDDISAIATWINSGAKDTEGNIPEKPNLQPNISGYVALDTAFQRLDTIRAGGFIANPFIVPPASSFYIAYAATDSLDGAEATAMADFTGCRIECSINKDDFTAATSFTSVFVANPSPAWVSTVPSGNWPQGTTVYFRIYINDGDHADDYEFPRNEVADYFKTFYAFYVQ